MILASLAIRAPDASSGLRHTGISARGHQSQNGIVQPVSGTSPGLTLGEPLEY